MRIPLAVLCLVLPVEAFASTCYAFVENLRRDGIGVQYASLDQVNTGPREVKITYVAHSTFRIESEEGVTIATDFFGSAGRDAEGNIIRPDVVTMNHAHSTHYTDHPDPEIPYVLRGWDHDGKGPANHRLRVRDVTIRNVTTNIRGWGAPEPDGNSIFIFEVADLCIGHLGHLHHRLTDEHYAEIGRLDVVMAPVDGTMTLDLPGMTEVLNTFKAQVVLPMHAFGTYSLQQFLGYMGNNFEVEINDGPSITLSYQTLPKKPSVILLPTAHSHLEPSFGED